MNRNLKIGLYILGAGVIAYVGYRLYKNYRMTSGNATKDGRIVTLRRSNPSQFVDDINDNL